MPRKRKPMSGVSYCTYPDGTVKECCRIQLDEYGKIVSVVYSMSDEERREYNEKMMQGVSERMSHRYDDNGDYIGDRVVSTDEY